MNRDKAFSFRAANFHLVLLLIGDHSGTNGVESLERHIKRCVNTMSRGFLRKYKTSLDFLN